MCYVCVLCGSWLSWHETWLRLWPVECQLQCEMLPYKMPRVNMQNTCHENQRQMATASVTVTVTAQLPQRQIEMQPQGSGFGCGCGCGQFGG